ncbi:hypothetical protein Bpfe_013401, partial [Biomphalaria pfeifferi]
MGTPSVLSIVRHLIDHTNCCPPQVCPISCWGTTSVSTLFRHLKCPYNCWGTSISYQL